MQHQWNELSESTKNFIRQQNKQRAINMNEATDIHEAESAGGIMALLRRLVRSADVPDLPGGGSITPGGGSMGGGIRTIQDQIQTIGDILLTIDDVTLKNFWRKLKLWLEGGDIQNLPTYLGGLARLMRTFGYEFYSVGTPPMTRIREIPGFDGFGGGGTDIPGGTDESQFMDDFFQELMNLFNGVENVSPPLNIPWNKNLIPPSAGPNPGGSYPNNPYRGLGPEGMLDPSEG
tara:strand:+ start:4507 stop:5205 length:699 start_codon:yes stop_codon:yes gene_type:complete